VAAPTKQRALAAAEARRRADRRQVRQQRKQHITLSRAPYQRRAAPRRRGAHQHQHRCASNARDAMPRGGITAPLARAGRGGHKPLAASAKYHRCSAYWRGSITRHSGADDVAATAARIARACAAARASIWRGGESLAMLSSISAQRISSILAQARHRGTGGSGRHGIIAAAA